MQVRSSLSITCAFILGACASSATGPATSSQAASARSPTLTQIGQAPIAIAPSKKARVHHLARGDNAYVGLLEMDAGAKVPVHRDATEEYIHILSGGGQMTIDGTTHEVRAGTTIYMPAHAEVSFANGEEATRALQVFAGPAPAAKYEKWMSASSDTSTAD